MLLGFSREREPIGYLYLYLYLYGEICYKELAHVVMEAENSQDGQSESWDPEYWVV